MAPPAGPPAVQQGLAGSIRSLNWINAVLELVQDQAAGPDDVNIVGASYRDRGEGLDSEADFALPIGAGLAQDGAARASDPDLAGLRRQAATTPAAPPVNWRIGDETQVPPLRLRTAPLLPRA